MSRYGLLSDIKKFFTSRMTNIFVFLRYKLGDKNYGLNEKENRDKLIVVTLTVIPSRISAAQISIDCILRQTVKPDKVIVNLGRELFEGVTLPKAFTDLKSRGVEIRFVDYIGPHTKYFYTLQDHPDDIIITIDDDVIYKKTVIQQLIESYKQHPSAVSCLRAHRMMFNNNHELMPYNQWEYETKIVNKPSYILFSTGAGGVLYPPNVFHKEVLNKEVFSKLCIRADDVWLKAMEILNNTQVVLASKDYRRLTLVINSQKIALKNTNIGKAENDIYIKEVFKYYGINYTDFLINNCGENL